MSSALFGRGTFLQTGNRGRQDQLDKQLAELRSFAVAATQEIRVLKEKVALLEQVLIHDENRVQKGPTSADIYTLVEKVVSLEKMLVTEQEKPDIPVLQLPAAATTSSNITVDTPATVATVEPAQPIQEPILQISEAPSAESSAPAPSADAVPESTT